MNVIFAVMILLELIFGFITISAMNRQQATKFHLQEMFQFDAIPNDSVEEVGVDQYGMEVRYRPK